MGVCILLFAAPRGVRLDQALHICFCAGRRCGCLSATWQVHNSCLPHLRSLTSLFVAWRSMAKHTGIYHCVPCGKEARVLQPYVADAAHPSARLPQVPCSLRRGHAPRSLPAAGAGSLRQSVSHQISQSVSSLAAQEQGPCEPCGRRMPPHCSACGLPSLRATGSWA